MARLVVAGRWLDGRDQLNVANAMNANEHPTANGTPYAIRRCANDREDCDDDDDGEEDEEEAATGYSSSRDTVSYS